MFISEVNTKMSKLNKGPIYVCVYIGFKEIQSLLTSRILKMTDYSKGFLQYFALQVNVR